MKLELWEAKVSVGKFDFFENLSAALGDTTDRSIRMCSSKGSSLRIAQ